MTVGKLADEELFLRSFFEKNEIRLGAPLIVISPFSSNASKDWPPERFGELAVHVESRYSAQIVMTHAPSELERARKLTADSAARIVVASGTSLLEYVAILRAARLVVCNDTSALHIAAAAGTPVVAMFGPTSPAETEPLVGERRIVTPKDGSRSIEAITMQQVVEAVDELLNGATDQM
jgi:ADP-heptose:LPS heptosyltransferase